MSASALRQGSSAELRELAAEGLGELVSATGEAALKPFVVQARPPLDHALHPASVLQLTAPMHWWLTPVEHLT